MASTNREVLEALRSSFPQLFSRREEDGQVVERIDLEQIRLLAGEGNYSDKYGLRWENKPERFDAESFGKLPTLKHVPGKGIHADPAKPTHVLIQGDNYHALKVLSYTHEHSVDVIYIDPPYNTGNKDFKYNDRFVDKEDGYRHSKWLSFMARRLSLARNLLKQSGVIYLSIDDNEYAGLKLLCDQIFGESNALPPFIRRTKVGGGSDSRHIVKEVDYVLCYARDIKRLPAFYVPFEDAYLRRYKEADDESRYFWDTYSRPGLSSDGTDYEVDFPDGSKRFSRWIRSQSRLKADLAKGDAKFLKTKEGWSLVFKQRLNALGKKPRQLLIEGLSNSDGNKDLDSVGLGGAFSYPKPVDLLRRIIGIAPRDAVVLDFFAGSGTTGHAVMQLNAEDGGRRQCILVTNDEGEFKGDAGNVLPGGICTHVTYPRLKKVIEGYTTPKGKQVAGLGQNLEFFEAAFQAVPKSRRQLQSFVRHSTSLLQLKAGCFTPVETKPEWSLHTDGSKHLFILFDDCAVEAALERLRSVEGQVVAYVFAYDSDDDSADVLGQLPNVTVQEVPQPLLDLFFRIKE